MNTNAIFGWPWGRMGNQLFQLALLFSLSERLGHGFYLPHNGEPIWDCFDLDVLADGPECSHRFDEVNGSCNYDPGVFKQPPGTSYHGYFQSYRYFDECRAELLRFLRFRFQYRALCETVLFDLRRRYGLPLASIHIRRDDYLSASNVERFGDLASEGYYDRAAEALGDGVLYLVFSDDIAWCRRSLDLEPVEFVSLDHCTSLCLMTRCDVNVIANSSFSWWGAYMNANSDVYAPSRWFGPSTPAPNDVQRDILPPAWRKIPAFGDRGSVRS